MHIGRREFVNGLTLAGTTGLLGWWPATSAAEPPPETTTLRLAAVSGAICVAPQYVAEALLGAEGFTQVQYVKAGADPSQALVSGQADLSQNHGAALMVRIDAGDPVVLLAGTHPGCLEVVGSEDIRSVRDLRGRTAAAPGPGSGRQVLLAAILASVGVDPRKEVNWVFHPMAEAVRLLAEKRIDALLAAPPDAQELRAKNIGRVLLSTTTDRPWSQYFCCLLASSSDFVRKNPVATKRALRAILKANVICAMEPERVAQSLVDKGYTTQYAYALQALRQIPYASWRDYSVEDTVRFYALRLHEAGLIKSSPQKIITQGTDWRFLDELKKELKG